MSFLDYGFIFSAIAPSDLSVTIVFSRSTQLFVSINACNIQYIYTCVVVHCPRCPLSHVINCLALSTNDIDLSFRYADGAKYIVNLEKINKQLNNVQLTRYLYMHIMFYCILFRFICAYFSCLL